ncbi:Acyl carrier protein [compost metagenome]
MLFEIDAKVIRVLSQCLPKVRCSIEMSTRLVEDLHMESIELVEFVMMLNEDAGVDVSADQVAEWKTVQDVCSCLRGFEG